MASTNDRPGRWDQFKADRADLAAARRDLDTVADRDNELGLTAESDEFLAANARVAQIEDAMPWWQREIAFHTTHQDNDTAAARDDDTF